jgi:hypothetical protein
MLFFRKNKKDMQIHRKFLETIVMIIEARNHNFSVAKRWTELLSEWLE